MDRKTKPRSRYSGRDEATIYQEFIGEAINYENQDQIFQRHTLPYPLVDYETMLMTNKAVTWSSSNTSVATVDSNGNVKQFLHKQSEETLRKLGAVNSQGTVNLDTGAIMLSVPLLNAFLKSSI